MNWQLYHPTRAFFGADCICQYGSAMKGLGERALIVTGQGGSSRQNGSLNDIKSVLAGMDIHSAIFDQVEANPSVETCQAGADMAARMEADFIIGVGGGSPLDAAKAMAILAVNHFSAEELFEHPAERVLPVVAVPTTSGTGSEVTPYSILTYKAIENKRSVYSEKIIPVLAFLDPCYTHGLPWQVTLDTAVDAFSHALESCLSVKATPFSELVALEALDILGREMRLLASGEMPGELSRERLMYASMLGGLAISVTMTNIPHAMGYPFTYHKDIPHGRANGFIMPSYIDFLMESPASPQVEVALRKAHFQSADDFRQVMEKLCGEPPVLADNEKAIFIDTISQARNLPNSLRVPSREELAGLLDSVLQSN